MDAEILQLHRPHHDYPHHPGCHIGCMPCEARTARADLRGLIRASLDLDDVWGSCQGWAYAVATALHLLSPAPSESLVPSEWRYRPFSSSLDWEDLREDSAEGALLADLVVDGDVSWHSLVYWGTVLLRYADVIRAAGRDY